MTKARPRPPIAHAIREARLDLRLSQIQLAELVLVSRTTVNAWEVGRTVPPMEQRQYVLGRLKNAPRATLDRLTHAFGFHVSTPVPSASEAPRTPTRDAAATRALMTNAVRAAADDLDVAPSTVRRTIAALLKRMKEASLTNAEIELAAEEKRRTT